MTHTNPINKDDAGYTTLLASLFVMIVAAVFSSTAVNAKVAAPLATTHSKIVVAGSPATSVAADTIVVTATRLK